MTWLIKIQVEKFEEAQKLLIYLPQLEVEERNFFVDIEYEELEDDL